MHRGATVHTANYCDMLLGLRAVLKSPVRANSSSPQDGNRAMPTTVHRSATTTEGHLEDRGQFNIFLQRAQVDSLKPWPPPVTTGQASGRPAHPVPHGEMCGLTQLTALTRPDVSSSIRLPSSDALSGDGHAAAANRAKTSR